MSSERVRQGKLLFVIFLFLRLILVSVLKNFFGPLGNILLFERTEIEASVQKSKVVYPSVPNVDTVSKWFDEFIDGFSNVGSQYQSFLQVSNPLLGKKKKELVSL